MCIRIVLANFSKNVAVQHGLVSPHEVTTQFCLLCLRRLNSMLVLQMVVREHGRDARLSWIIRAPGFVLCWISISLILQPVCIFLKVMPALGDLCGM